MAAEIEIKISNILTRAGFNVLRNGWPDFLVEDPEGNPFFLEVKGASDRIRGPQLIMLQKLADLGFPVFVVSQNPKEDLQRKFNWLKTNYSTGNVVFF